MSEEEQKQRTEVPPVPSETLTKKTGLLTQEVSRTLLKLFIHNLISLCGFLLLTLLALILFSCIIKILAEKYDEYNSILACGLQQAFYNSYVSIQVLGAGMVFFFHIFFV